MALPPPGSVLTSAGPWLTSVAAEGGFLRVAADTSIVATATSTAERRMGSAFIGAPDSAVGILTQSDLTRRAMVTGVDRSMPVAAIITAQVATIDADAAVLAAYVATARRHRRRNRQGHRSRRRRPFALSRENEEQPGAPGGICGE